MKHANTKFHQSGRLAISRDVVEYVLPDQPASYRQNWTLPISQIKVVGEYTNSDGPYLDDYFFVLVLADGSWRQASFYAEGAESFLSELGNKLGHKLDCGLSNSTSLKSRVLWPAELTGQILFTFARATEPKNPFAGFLEKISPSFLFEFSEPVRKALNQ